MMQMAMEQGMEPARAREVLGRYAATHAMTPRQRKQAYIALVRFGLEPERIEGVLGWGLDAWSAHHAFRALAAGVSPQLVSAILDGAIRDDDGPSVLSERLAVTLDLAQTARTVMEDREFAERFLAPNYPTEKLSALRLLAEYGGLDLPWEQLDAEQVSKVGVAMADGLPRNRVGRWCRREIPAPVMAVTFDALAQEDPAIDDRVLGIIARCGDESQARAAFDAASALPEYRRDYVLSLVEHDAEGYVARTATTALRVPEIDLPTLDYVIRAHEWRDERELGFLVDAMRDPRLNPDAVDVLASAFAAFFPLHHPAEPDAMNALLVRLEGLDDLGEMEQARNEVIARFDAEYPLIDMSAMRRLTEPDMGEPAAGEVPDVTVPTRHGTPAAEASGYNLASESREMAAASDELGRTGAAIGRGDDGRDER